MSANVPYGGKPRSLFPDTRDKGLKSSHSERNGTEGDVSALVMARKIIAYHASLAETNLPELTPVHRRTIDRPAEAFGDPEGREWDRDGGSAPGGNPEITKWSKMCQIRKP